MAHTNVGHVPLAVMMLGMVAGSGSLAVNGISDSAGTQQQIHELLTQRLGVLEEIARLQRAAYERGEAKFEAVLAAEHELFSARLELATTADDRGKIRNRLVQTARELEELTNEMFNAGRGVRTDLLQAQALRLRAEADLVRERPNDTGATDPPPARAGHLDALAQARLEVVQKFHERREQWQKHAVAGATSPGETYRWSRRWLEAEQDATSNAEDQIRAFENHLTRMKELEDRIKIATRSGTVAQANALEMEFYRLEAEYWLARAKAK